MPSHFEFFCCKVLLPQIWHLWSLSFWSLFQRPVLEAGWRPGLYGRAACNISHFCCDDSETSVLFVCFCFPKRLLLSSFYVNTLVCPLQSCYWKYVPIASIRTWSCDTHWLIARLRHGNRSSACRIIPKTKAIDGSRPASGFLSPCGFAMGLSTIRFFTGKHLDPKRQLGFAPLQMSPSPNFRKAHVWTG